MERKEKKAERKQGTEQKKVVEIIISMIWKRKSGHKMKNKRMIEKKRNEKKRKKYWKGVGIWIRRKGQMKRKEKK